ncbi:GapA-binding peptide SR1P [Paenibacillus alkaliterrae]
MENKCIDLGVIICKHCMSVIDTLPTERVTTYYSDFQEQECLKTRRTDVIQIRNQCQQVKAYRCLGSTIHLAIMMEFGFSG